MYKHHGEKTSTPRYRMSFCKPSLLASFLVGHLTPCEFAPIRIILITKMTSPFAILTTTELCKPHFLFLGRSDVAVPRRIGKGGLYPSVRHQATSCASAPPSRLRDFGFLCHGTQSADKVVFAARLACQQSMHKRTFALHGLPHVLHRLAGFLLVLLSVISHSCY